jgi:hypothetical protein
MGRGEDARVLPVVLNLSSPRKPITKGEHRLPRTSEIPAVNIAIHGAGSEEVWVVSGKIDVSDGPTVPLERMLDGAGV